MLEESIFTKEDIINIVKEKYNIDVNDVEKLTRGSANVYKLEDNDGKKYIFKEFQEKYKTEDIEKEINVIRVLEDKRLKVPHYIKLTNGDFSFVTSNHVVIMQSFIDGDCLEINTGNKDMLNDSARLLAEIVNGLEGIEDLEEDRAEKWFDEKECKESIVKFNSMIEDISEKDLEKKDLVIKDLNDKISMIGETLKHVDISEIKEMTHKNSHGDYNVLQIIYENNKINAVIDFAAAKKLPIAWELIRSYSYLDEASKDGDINPVNLREYVEEFCKVSKLNKYDIKYMTSLYLIQILTSGFGYKQYIKSGNEELLDFAIFRTKLARTLFNKADEIQEELNKIEL